MNHATTTIPVSAECEYRGCKRPSEIACIITGEYGPNSIGAYCDVHAESHAGASDNHTEIATVERHE